MTRVGTLNARVGHPKPARLAERILKIAARDDLDVLALQEARSVARVLDRKAKAHGYKVVGKPRHKNPMVRDNLLLVRRGMKASKPHVRTWGGKWERAKRNRHKGLHPARRALWARVAGVNVLVVHGPPRPHTDAFPKRRRASRRYYDRLAKHTRKWTRRGKHPWVALGDWNLRGPQVARRIDARVAVRGIDGLATGPGVDARNVKARKLSGWFDHQLVSARLEIEEMKHHA